MWWQTRDYMRNRDMTVWEQIKYNFSVPKWKFQRWLANMGFLNTPEGCWMRFRDFTPFFWRTLLARQKARYEFKLRSLEQARAAEIHIARMEAVESFVERFSKELRP